MGLFEVIIIFLILYFIFNKKFRMSIIKDFKALSDWEKSLVITFVALIPFWILSFYLFKPDILKYEWPVILSIAGAISIGFYILNTINVFLQSVFFNDEDFFVVGSVSQPIIELGIIIAITYFFSLSFKTMILIAFGINIYRCLLLGIFFLTKKHK